MARREEPARLVADCDAGQLHQRQARVARPDRRRRAGQGRGKELGVEGRDLPCAGVGPLHGGAVRRRRRRRDDARVRRGERRLRRGRFRTADRQGQRRLGRTGRAVRCHRLRGRQPDQLGLSPHRQALAARRWPRHGERCCRRRRDRRPRRYAAVHRRRYAMADVHPRHRFLSRGGQPHRARRPAGPHPAADRCRDRGRDRRPPDRQAADAVRGPSGGCASRLFDLRRAGRQDPGDRNRAAADQKPVDRAGRGRQGHGLGQIARRRVGQGVGPSAARRRANGARPRSTSPPTRRFIWRLQAASQKSPLPPSRGC